MTRADTRPGSVLAVGSPKALALAVFSTALEGYDTTIYGLFALAVGRAFFPGRDPASSLLLAVGTFGVGYVVRPLGGLVLGAYADRVGRSAAVSLIVVVMALSTGLVGLVPGYGAIGLAGPLLVVAARLAQGFGAGGAAAGSIAYLVESAQPDRRGLVGSLQQGSQVGAFMVTSALAAVVTGLFGAGGGAGWSWRIPFLIALLLGPVGLYVRRRLPEPEPGEALREARALGLGRTLLAERRAILVGAGLTCLWNASIFILLFYMPTYFQSALGVAPRDAFLSSTAGAAVLFVSCPVMGWLSDRWGRKAVMLGAALALLVGAYPVFSWLQGHHGLGGIVAAQAVTAVPVAAYIGPVAAALAELFPTRSRSTGLSVASNLTTLVLGAFGPFFVVSLIGATHNRAAPAFYVAGCALVSGATLLLTRDRTGEPL